MLGLTTLVGGLGTRKVTGCFKQGLMSHPNKSMEGSGAEDQMAQFKRFQREAVSVSNLEPFLCNFEED